MVPTHRSRGVSPTEASLVARGEDVAAKVTREKHLVFVAKFIVRLQRKVVKVELRTLDGFTQERCGEYVDVRTPTSQKKRGLVLHNWCFHAKPAEDGADTALHFELLVVAFPHSHVEDGTKPATVARGDTTFIKLHTLHRIRVEDGEKTEQVAGVEYRCLIQDYQVLINGATTNVEARRTLTYGGNPG